MSINHVAVVFAVAFLGSLTGLAPVTHAQDCNGDGILDSQQINVQGLVAQYFPNPTWSGTPVARVDLGRGGSFDLNSANGWTLPAGIPQDDFTVRWTGGLLFNQSALFQFKVSHDDGCWFYLDGVLLGGFESNGEHTFPATPMQINAGVHWLQVKFRENTGAQNIRVSRKVSTTSTWSVIANSNFIAGIDANSNGVLDICEGADCNGTFVPDSVEIAQNPSLDCNANLVLDQCESVAIDCDQNGIPDSCEEGLAGLVGSYYATDDFSGPVVARRLDANGPLGLDFNVTDQSGGNTWQPSNVPTDYFSVRWTGQLNIPVTGNYYFQMQSDDTATMRVDTTLLFTSNTGSTERGPFLLTAGVHLVQYDLREFGGDQRMRVRVRMAETGPWDALPGSWYQTRVDLNSNGASDLCEFGDCDNNQVPDNIQLAQGGPDCNGNGKLDACDIAAGAPDCNSNGAIDTCESTVNGLYGRYFTSIGGSDPADPFRPGTLLSKRFDGTINFGGGNWFPNGVPDNDVIVIWTGALLTPNESGVYQFHTDSDDGCRLYIDDTIVIDRWLGGQGTGFGTKELQGQTTYSIRMEFHEGGGEQRVTLRWLLPSQSGGAPAIIPSSAFRVATPDCNQNGQPDDCDIANGKLPNPGDGIPIPCATAPCPGDFDQDGRVTAADLSNLLGAWGTAGADLNADGFTNGADLAILLSEWGDCS